METIGATPHDASRPPNAPALAPLWYSFFVVAHVAQRCASTGRVCAALVLPRLPRLHTCTPFGTYRFLSCAARRSQYFEHTLHRGPRIDVSVADPQGRVLSRLTVIRPPTPVVTVSP